MSKTRIISMKQDRLGSKTFMGGIDRCEGTGVADLNVRRVLMRQKT